MKVSNRAGLPDALVRAVENDPYTKGESDFSVTQLIKPPRITALEEKHRGEIEEDAEDRLWSLYGQIAHLILERANRTGFAEKRLFCEVEGYRVSGQLDTLDIDHGTLSDWKFTTAWKFKIGQPAPDEWIAQLNMQLELLRVNGMDAKRLQIVGLIRDFSKMEAKRNPDYPQSSVIVMPITLWSREKTLAYMRERVILHVQARMSLPECLPEDRWAKAEVWAVMKKGKKRAERLHYSEESAAAHVKNGTGLSVVHRPGENVRCENYCSVSRFCSQFQAASKQAKQALMSQKEDEDEIQRVAQG